MTANLPTVTVLGSHTVARDDGSAAMVLETKERGPIAFEVTLQTIPLIRAELDQLERVLRQRVS